MPIKLFRFKNVVISTWTAVNITFENVIQVSVETLSSNINDLGSHDQLVLKIVMEIFVTWLNVLSPSLSLSLLNS